MLHVRAERGRPGRRWSSTTVFARLPLAVDPDRLLRETLAHEYFHGMQCRLAPRLELLPPSIVEGTANWMAAAVIDRRARAEGPFLGTLPGRLLRSAASIRSITRQGYDAWGFWFQATQGRHAPVADPHAVPALGEPHAPHRTATPRCAPSCPRSSRPCCQYALALRGARPLGGTDAAAGVSRATCATRRRCSTWGRAARRPALSADRPIGYRFPAWPGRTMRDESRSGCRCTAGSSIDRGRAATGSRATVSTVFEIDAELAGEADGGDRERRSDRSFRDHLGLPLRRRG